MALSYDESYQKGINDANSGRPASPPAAQPHVADAYRAGRADAKATKGDKSSG